MQEAVIVSSVRSPVGKAPRGKLRYTRPDEIAAQVLAEVIKRVPQVPKEEYEDVVVGCAFPEGTQGMNVARTIALRVGLPDNVPAMTVNRFCSSGLQAIASAAQSIMCGFTKIAIAGGVESMSSVPMGGYQLLPNPYLMENRPGYYLPMGLTAEEVSRRYGITREMQDEFAVLSHKKALKAIMEKRFAEEYAVIEAIEVQGHKACTFKFEADEGPRPDTTMESLSKLKPAFYTKGTVTAGNASQTSDGAAFSVLMSGDKAKELEIKPLAFLRTFVAAGVEPEVMGIGPIKAIPKALKLAGLTIDQIGLWEINEAFAAQALACVKALDIDIDKVNVNGGAIALGHPLGCTGAKLTATIIHEMKKRNVRYGVVSMCIGGGMGAAGVFELA